jgi:hypothetical protein
MKKQETIIQKKIMEFLKLRDWYCKNTHGNIYQGGLPDIYACHRRHGTRWIEVKMEKYNFTPAQIDTFSELTAKGVGIWILTDATEFEYNKLFEPANWHWFLK